MISVNQISERYDLHIETIRYRSDKLKIPFKKNEIRFYTKEQVDLIVNYQKQKHISKKRGYNKNKVDIIDMYLNAKCNNCTHIGDTLNLRWHYVNRVINEWLENDKTITVISDL